MDTNIRLLESAIPPKCVKDAMVSPLENSSVISNYYSWDGTISYASMSDFAANKVDTVVVSGLNPARTMPKTESFGYVQDEWKIRPNLTVNLGLRYEFFNELSERYNRTLGFNILCPFVRGSNCSVAAAWTKRRRFLPYGG